MFQLQLFFLLHCDEWDRVVALPRHKFVTGATLLQLDLPQQYRVTICRYQKEVRIDFRHFINEHPTIKRLYFNTRQWNYLKRLAPHIDKSISNAVLFE